ncbi:hypothetical protein [Helicobacter sp.]|uniref:hypothetical protein n=1 Tax=Helicobacter sp. TaxID=218 RepID=UPI001989D73F|nr:hypothetical protein [Helicobacter sp.]MBD5166139.1 hypothetical protein [Helicobacter sp.]
MTLTLKNVDSATLRVIKCLKAFRPELKIKKISKKQKSKKVKAKLSIEKTDDFQYLRESMLQDLKKPENKAVFERLKDK